MKARTLCAISWKLLTLISLISAAGCDAEPNGADVSVESPRQVQGAIRIRARWDLPRCFRTLEGVVYYLEDSEELVVCTDGRFVDIPLPLSSGDLLVLTTPSGDECPSGGTLITIGVDADGDSLPDPGSATFPLCDGATGPAGADGKDGEDGKAGEDGSSCSVTDNGDGTKTISCTDGTSVTVSDGKDGKDGEPGATATDADGDGFDAVAFGGADCDDSNATVFPGATELPYDGIDSDCDGDADLTPTPLPADLEVSSASLAFSSGRYLTVFTSTADQTVRGLLLASNGEPLGDVFEIAEADADAQVAGNDAGFYVSASLGGTVWGVNVDENGGVSPPTTLDDHQRARVFAATGFAGGFAVGYATYSTTTDCDPFFGGGCTTRRFSNVFIAVVPDDGPVLRAWAPGVAPSTGEVLDAVGSIASNGTQHALVSTKSGLDIYDSEVDSFVTPAAASPKSGTQASVLFDGTSFVYTYVADSGGGACDFVRGSRIDPVSGEELSSYDVSLLPSCTRGVRTVALGDRVLSVFENEYASGSFEIRSQENLLDGTPVGNPSVNGFVAASTEPSSYSSTSLATDGTSALLVSVGSGTGGQRLFVDQPE